MNQFVPEFLQFLLTSRVKKFTYYISQDGEILENSRSIFVRSAFVRTLKNFIAPTPGVRRLIIYGYGREGTCQH